jgi:hypothetical protein
MRVSVLGDCVIGWVDIGIGTKGKWGFVVSLAKVWEIAIRFFNQSTFIAEVITFRVMQYIRVKLHLKRVITG